MRERAGPGSASAGSLAALIHSAEITDGSSGPNHLHSENLRGSVFASDPLNA